MFKKDFTSWPSDIFWQLIFSFFLKNIPGDLPSVIWFFSSIFVGFGNDKLVNKRHFFCYHFSLCQISKNCNRCWSRVNIPGYLAPTLFLSQILLLLLLFRLNIRLNHCPSSSNEHYLRSLPLLISEQMVDDRVISSARVLKLFKFLFYNERV